MTPQLAALLAGFLLQAWPIAQGGALKLLQLLVDMIPSEEKTLREFHTMCMRQIAGVWAETANDPNATDQFRRELAHDSIIIRAREMNVSIDATLFTTLGLA